MIGVLRPTIHEEIQAVVLTDVAEVQAQPECISRGSQFRNFNFQAVASTQTADSGENRLEENVWEPINDEIAESGGSNHSATVNYGL